MTMLKQAIEDATSFQAEIDNDLFEVEQMLQGAQKTADVQFLGKTWVFTSLDDFWESWALSEMPAVEDVYLRHRLRKAPYVAAAFIGLRQEDGSIKSVEDMFKPKGSANAAISNLTVRTRQAWARKQFLLWLRSGSRNEARSGQHGDLVERLFNEGVMVAANQNREALSKIDPFFGAGQEEDLLQTLLSLTLSREGEESEASASAEAASGASAAAEESSAAGTASGDGLRVDTLDGPSGLSSSQGLVTY